ncbi:MAG TPA: hypothetical protein VMU40_07695 [Steroidobacteraceae bacterium]|nr:hypothetical protein [Steroidobacteraceae bacterium]
MHADAARANLLLASGKRPAEVARKFGMSDDALRRHWANHVSEEQRAALVLGGRALIDREGLAAEVAEQSQSIIENLRGEAAVLWRHLLREQTGTKAAMVAGALTKVYSLLGHFTGELSQSPLISHQHVHLHFSESPEFVQFIERIGQILEPYPEARVAIFRAVEALEHGGQAEVIPEPKRAALGLEHAPPEERSAPLP